MKTILFFFCVTIPFWILAESQDSWKPIDLRKGNWIAVEGFQREYLNGIDSTFSKSKKISHFPVVLNEIFETSVGTGLKEYTLQTRFRIQEDFQKTKVYKPIFLYLESIGENWEIFLNDHSLAQEIHLDISHKEMILRRTIRSFRLPVDSSLLRSGENLLTFRLIGDAPASFLSKNVDLGFYIDGDYSLTTEQKLSGEISTLINLCLNTIYVFFGFYHLLIYVKRREDLYNLYFGIFSVFMALYSLSRSNIAFEVIYDTTWITRIEYSSVSLLAPLFLLFMQDYFYGRAKFSKVLFAILILNVVIALTTLLEPFRYTMTSLRLWQISILPTLVYLLYFMSKAVYLRKKDAILLATSMFTVVFIAVYDVIDSIFFQSGIRFTQFAYFLFVVALTTILANRFISLYRQSEDLNIELSQQKLELARQKNAFFRFVPVQFLNVLGKNSAVEVNLGDSVLKEMSVLFTDIRSFTTISEQMTPEENFRFINDYLASMEPVVQRHEGFVDKFMGDGILALFSGDGEITRSHQTSADKAILAAIEMKKKVQTINAQAKDSHFRGLKIGIGINTGNLMLGTVGSRSRLDTTVIGDTVNVASRLESLTNLYRADILITKSTLSAMTIADNLAIREIDSVVVKGKTDPIIIYEIYEADEPLIRKLKDATLSLITRGIILYKVADFQEALINFEQALKIFPEDIVPILYRKRCQEYITSPPTGNWVGVQHLLEK
ncbi:adenylate/guanylate cyclase domain-containing protein [Leptospira interrogans]|uniref:Adenylate/guanylate cyclase catalytic domain protein n=3 Tax=Leptospira interrogans TaxID=173 RepID=A0A0F6H9N1_LEPIR|nr:MULTISPECIES: adenylate/guanylate cyclase domain-containing protein [Leptospira]AJR16307.1 adenylate cyclase [Leptospira interrogans serovar Linhai str. 56609]EJO78647.1 adenylate/guanylate cyclase catalytic domain protein [Leptospira interrogans serovar Pomona str. Kennewicki LC82-25]EKN95304.1 adenylate/guanylate cyclase catalytic domain protein [Leptospira interrogans serovar Pomona str. Pomona]EKO24972.1 adenylate/guanylate cyclase catalytic domain protein [Leptospira interrogans str. UI